MGTYTNTHTNHTDDASKNWPVSIPWSTDWDSGTLAPNVSSITGDLLRELRQHAKAVEANFSLAATDPTYENVTDVNTARGEKINRSQINEADNSLTVGGAGLLDGIETIGTVLDPLSPVVAGGKVTGTFFSGMANKLENLSGYANYTNYANSGYGQYVNYSQYSQEDTHINYGRYSEYNRGIHFDNDNDPSKYTNYGRYTNTNVYNDTSDPGYNNGTYGDTTIAYSNASYSNSYSNPATYQNTL